MEPDVEASIAGTKRLTEHLSALERVVLRSYGDHPSTRRASPDRPVDGAISRRAHILQQRRRFSFFEPALTRAHANTRALRSRAAKSTTPISSGDSRLPIVLGGLAPHFAIGRDSSFSASSNAGSVGEDGVGSDQWRRAKVMEPELAIALGEVFHGVQGRVAIMSKLASLHIYTRDQLASSWNSDEMLLKAEFSLIETRKLRSIGSNRLEELSTAPLSEPEGVPGHEIDWAKYDMTNLGDDARLRRPSTRGRQYQPPESSPVKTEPTSSYDGAMRAMGDWREVESTTYNATYWFNNKTGETRWILPGERAEAGLGQARSQW